MLQRSFAEYCSEIQQELDRIESQDYSDDLEGKLYTMDEKTTKLFQIVEKKKERQQGAKKRPAQQSAAPAIRKSLEEKEMR